jgi:hypothetical protein
MVVVVVRMIVVVIVHMVVIVPLVVVRNAFGHRAIIGRPRAETRRLDTILMVSGAAIAMLWREWIRWCSQPD